MERTLHQQLFGRPAIEAMGQVVRAGDVTNEQVPKVVQRPQEAQPTLHHPTLTGCYSVLPCIVRRVAIPLLQSVKERMKPLGVIVKVEQSTDWCAGMVVLSKPNGKIRICVNLTKLNKSVLREHHPSGNAGWGLSSWWTVVLSRRDQKPHCRDVAL